MLLSFLIQSYVFLLIKGRLYKNWGAKFGWFGERWNEFGKSVCNIQVVFYFSNQNDIPLTS